MNGTPSACAGCGTLIPPALLACPVCRRLVHGEAIRALVAKADALGESDPTTAVVHLRDAVARLPRGSEQARALEARITQLEAHIGAAPESSNTPKWLAGLGVVGAALAKFGKPLFLLLSKGKFLLAGLFKAKTAISMLIYASFARGGGQALWLVFVACLYVHEMGHVYAFRRYGIPVTAPMFVPGFGAFVRVNQYPRDTGAASDVALSGPIWGVVAGFIVLAIAAATSSPGVARMAVFVAEVNAFNLIPVWQLDGARAVAVLSRRQRGAAGAVGVALGLLSGCTMLTGAAIGMIVRSFVVPGEATGDRRPLVRLLVVMVLCALLEALALRVAGT